MDDFRPYFSDFEGRVWMNCAHQGPLPKAAAAAAREAVAWKMAPHQLTGERFADVPDRLRRGLARLLGVPREEVVLANSASYGLHLLANGLSLAPGDEVVLVEGDFPSNLLPWDALAERGVRLRALRPRHPLPDADELASALGPATRVVCLSWVHSFSGWVADLESLGQVCRQHGAWLLVNASQGLGARPLAPAALPVDAVVSVGFKWLCGPYGTGLLWMRPALRETLRYNQAYWLARQSATDLADENEPGGGAPTTGGGPVGPFDVFGTANFFNFRAWTACVELLLAFGIERVAAHDQELVSRLVEGIAGGPYAITSPIDAARRSALLFLTHRDPARNGEIQRRLETEGIDIALRRGRLRIAPHVHNTLEDVERVVKALLSAG